MFEMILGSGRQGKSMLAFDRAVTECKNRNRRLICFSRKETIDWIIPKLDLHFLECRLSTQVYQQFNTMEITENSFKAIGNIIFSTLGHMTKVCSWPEVVVIDLNWPLESFKYISGLEELYPDVLFIVTMDKRETTEYLNKYNINQLREEKENWEKEKENA